MIENTIPFLLFALFFWSISYIDIFRIKIDLEKRNFLLFFALVILVIFAGGRWSAYEIGYDTEIFDYSTYKNIYCSPLNIFSFFSEYESSNALIKAHEEGYVFYSSFCHLLLGNNYNLYLLFTNLLLVLLFYKSLIRNDIKCGIFLLLCFFATRLYLQYNFTLLRQAIALFIIWAYGYPLVIKSKYISYIGIVLLASTFHFTALINLIAILFNRTLNYKRILCCIALFFLLNVCGIVDYFLIHIIEWGLSLIGISGGIGEKLSKYLLEGGGEYRGLNLLNFVEVIPFAYVAIKYRENLYKSSFGRFYYNMFYIFVLLLVVTMNFGFLTRAIQYFMLSYFYLLSFYCKMEVDMKKKRLILSVFSCYLLVYSVRYIFIWFYHTEYSFFLFYL